MVAKRKLEERGKEKKTGLLAFYEMCNNHDWFFDFSNNPKVVQRGEALEARLKRISKQSPRHKRIFDGFFNHNWKMDPFKSNKYIFLPKRPRE